MSRALGTCGTLKKSNVFVTGISEGEQENMMQKNMLGSVNMF